MSAPRSFRCRLGWHSYGPIEGDDLGAHQTCAFCQRTRKVDTHQPPEMHDHQ